MKTWKLIALPLAIGVASVSVAFAVRPGENEKTERVVQWSDVPADARDALEKAAGGSPIEQVETESEDGVTVYEASWNAHGIEHEVSVDAAGSVLETEQSVKNSDLPKAVRDSVASLCRAGEVISFEKKTITLYSVEFVVNGTEKEVLLDPAGRRMELEADEDLNRDEDGDDEDEDDDE